MTAFSAENTAFADPRFALIELYF